MPLDIAGWHACVFVVELLFGMALFAFNVIGGGDWAQDRLLPDAVRAARQYVRAALIAGAPVCTGHGVGPLDHGFAPRPMVLRERR